MTEITETRSQAVARIADHGHRADCPV